MKNINPKPILTLLFIVLFQAAFAQTFNKTKLDNKQSILNDKVFLYFPSEAKNEPREANIMAADYNINEETRIVLDIDKKKLVVFAQELYLLADDNFFAEISEDKTSSSVQWKILTKTNELQSILATPTSIDESKEVALINTLLVKTKDNAIFRIDAYINADAYSTKSEFIQLSERIFQTLANGTRKNELSAREETFNILDSEKKLQVALPENYSITVDKKYGFQVLNFHKYLDYEDDKWVELTIYLGGHPSYYYGEYGFDEKALKKVEGKFLDKNIQWLSFQDTNRQIYIKEQYIPSNYIFNGLIIHVAMITNKEEILNELTKIVESIQLK
ncbi:MAG: hypothetical protein EAZ55_11030 [Cytophagales bacterium]|nr:MAG: hypothetical protein EAZ55_11030 [Cytophagales bacterium]